MHLFSGHEPLPLQPSIPSTFWTPISHLVWIFQRYRVRGRGDVRMQTPHPSARVMVNWYIAGCLSSINTIPDLDRSIYKLSKASRRSSLPYHDVESASIAHLKPLLPSLLHFSHDLLHMCLILPTGAHDLLYNYSQQI